MLRAQLPWDALSSFNSSVFSGSWGCAVCPRAKANVTLMRCCHLIIVLCCHRLLIAAFVGKCSIFLFVGFRLIPN